LTIKIKKNFDLEKRLAAIQLGFIQAAPKVIRDAILVEIGSGRSPVDGGQWDRPYSASYLASIRGDIMFRFIKKLQMVVPLPGPDPVIFQFDKKPSPVNLKLSGQLLEALEVRTKLNSMIVTFKDTMRRKLGNEKKVISNSELADIHNRIGAGASGAIRRILPTVDGEDFNRTIQLKMDQLLRKVVRDSIK
jgi:hypothetical protein